jgi:hypothetical protein
LAIPIGIGITRHKIFNTCLRVVRKFYGSFHELVKEKHFVAFPEPKIRNVYPPQ